MNRLLKLIASVKLSQKWKVRIAFLVKYYSSPIRKKHSELYGKYFWFKNGNTLIDVGFFHVNLFKYTLLNSRRITLESFSDSSCSPHKRKNICNKHVERKSPQTEINRVGFFCFYYACTYLLINMSTLKLKISRIDDSMEELLENTVYFNINYI